MPMFVGAVLALVALAAGILGQVDPVACVGRAGLAFLLGLIGTQLWYVVLVGSAPRAPARASASGEED